jgi:hypothetical protein
MSVTAKSISQCGLTRTVTLTTDYQDLFNINMVNGTVDVNMVQGGTDIGTLKIIIGGGIAKTDVSTGGLYFDQSIDNTRLPTIYTPTSNNMSYTIKFNYDSATTRLQIAKELNDPELDITFTAQYSSCMDVYPNNVFRVDKLVENNNGSGIEVSHVLKLNGGLEMSALPSDTIVFNQDHEFITFTNISSKATRVGKICDITIKATLDVAGALLAANSIHDFFSVTPTEQYKSSYVRVGTAMEGATNSSSTIFNDANSADFKLVLPMALSDNSSTTIYASITYTSS